ncbi:hypothetical protein, partial [Nonomuraea sp. NPDC003201]
GWASLARGLAASFGQGRPEAELFERAAATAGTLGLAAARDLLAGQATGREELAQAARGRSAFAQARAYAPPPVLPPRDEGDIVTLLHVPGRSSGPVQFGPGIGTQEQRPETTAERIWRAGRDQAATEHRPGVRLAKASRARRRRTITSAALFAVIMAGAVLAWFHVGKTPELAVESIDVVAPKKTQGCDKAVLITGTVVTNGAPGEITYEWRKNLDKEVVKGTLRTKADQTRYEVPLRWTLQGRSNVKATATLRILTPGPVRSDKASFTYKC